MSPWNIQRGDRVVVVFKAFPKVMTQKGPLWDCLEGDFRDWIETDGQKTGFVLRARWGISTGLADVDLRLSLDDILTVGTVGQVSLVTNLQPAARAALGPNGH